MVGFDIGAEGADMNIRELAKSQLNREGKPDKPVPQSPFKVVMLPCGDLIRCADEESYRRLKAYADAQNAIQAARDPWTPE